MSKEQTSPEVELGMPSKEVQSIIKKVSAIDDLTKEEKIDIIKGRFNVTEDKIDEWLKLMDVEIVTKQFAAAKNKAIPSAKRYLISNAQNASIVNKEFLSKMQKYAEKIDATIIIIPTRYKNPTSIFNEENDYWDSCLDPYLIAKNQYLSNSVYLLGGLKVIATSSHPTSGLQTFANDASIIVGNPRIEMTPLPSLPGCLQRFLFSTGSVTYPNFTDTVAGGKAERIHSFGFVIVEIEDEDISYIRNVEADNNGDFNDLIYRVDERGITTEATEALVWGDSHFAKEDPKVTKAFRKLTEDLGITTSVLHDVFDAESINVHNIKNQVVKHQLMMEGKDDLEKELENLFKNLDWFDEFMDQTYVIASNHDDMLDRVLASPTCGADDIKNLKALLDLKLCKLDKPNESVIAGLINEKHLNIVATDLNTSVRINGVEVGLHGHKGPNGTKGSPKVFDKLGFPTVIGHGHAPTIYGNCYQVGVSCSLDHGYNSGLSSWAYNGVTINKYGKRQSITLNHKTLNYTTLY